MRTLLVAGILTLCSTFAGVGTPGTHHHSCTNITISSDDDEIKSCDDITVRFDDEKAVRETQELPVGDLRSLKVVSEDHGGIRVFGWEKPSYAVTACKAAAMTSDLRDIRVNLSGNEVTSSGPSSQKWCVFFIVHAPRNAVLELDTHNGPISVHDVGGTIVARAVNGPVSVKDANGTISVNTTNGPIAYSGGSGTVKLAAVNGPLSVRLTGAKWEGSLDGRTENGPLALKLPRDFGSGVMVTSEGHGPISCRSDLCRTAQRAMRDAEDDDEEYGHRGPRTMTFGHGANNVTLTTVNGPIAVKDSD